MTAAISPTRISEWLSKEIPGSVAKGDEQKTIITPSSLHDAVRRLKEHPDFAFDYLNFITAVDYYDYFEVVYMFTSLKHNHSATLRVQCPREKPTVPSIYDLFRGSDLQERETFDLMGIVFEGHPNLKRIVLWDTFVGHPLRKDYL